MSATENEKIYFAWPTRFGFPSFQIQTSNGSFQGGFLAAKKRLVKDQQTEKEETYYLYESIDTNLQGTLFIS